MSRGSIPESGRYTPLPARFEHELRGVGVPVRNEGWDDGLIADGVRVQGGDGAALSTEGPPYRPLRRTFSATDATLPSSERVYGALRHQILSGELKPNQRLVELQLAGQFGLSRTPVREALKRLSAEGLVALDPVRGTIVRHVDAAEVEDIYAIREALDGLAARLAATYGSDGDIAKLQLIAELMEESAHAGHWEAIVQINIMFHEVLYSASHNERLAAMARSLQDAVRQYSSLVFTDPDRVGEVVREHAEIVAALEARDPDRAEAACRGHMDRAREHMAHIFAAEGQLAARECGDNAPAAPGAAAALAGLGDLG